MRRHCSILHDEIYVKKMLLYHGGALLGKTLNKSDLLAETALGILVICLPRDPKFMCKIIHAMKMHSAYLHEHLKQSVKFAKT